MGDQQAELTYEGALLCDGPGQEAIVQALPLKDGYQVNCNVIDLTAMKVETAQLKVEGSDSIDNQELLKVVITNVANPAQKTTLWLDPKTKTVVRTEQVLPQMGNAVLSKTLEK